MYNRTAKIELSNKNVLVIITIQSYVKLVTSMVYTFNVMVMYIIRHGIAHLRHTVAIQKRKNFICT